MPARMAKTRAGFWRAAWARLLSLQPWRWRCSIVGLATSSAIRSSVVSQLRSVLCRLQKSVWKPPKVATFPGSAELCEFHCVDPNMQCCSKPTPTAGTSTWIISLRRRTCVSMVFETRCGLQGMLGFEHQPLQQFATQGKICNTHNTDRVNNWAHLSPCACTACWWMSQRSLAAARAR